MLEPGVLRQLILLVMGVLVAVLVLVSVYEPPLIGQKLKIHKEAPHKLLFYQRVLLALHVVKAVDVSQLTEFSDVIQVVVQLCLVDCLLLQIFRIHRGTGLLRAISPIRKIHLFFQLF